jgi:hypothetical protein
MLNKATLEIYFLGSDSSDEKISKPSVTIEKEPVVEIPEISDVVEEADEVLPEEELVPEEPVPEEESNDVVPEEEIFVEEETIEEETEEETIAEEEFVEEEETVIENIPEENTVSEDSIFNSHDNMSDKPLFEWEIDKSESVAKTQEDDINLLKLQLEAERKRLEQELQNWQDERRRRDEEILAAKKLLESLQQQTAINQAQQQIATQQSQPVVQPQPAIPQQPQPAIPQQPQPTIPQQTQPAIQPIRKVQQPQQSTKSEPVIKKEIPKEPTKKEDSQEAIIDRFIGTKKVLHENFETNNMVNQISTPVASLPRAIGINDKFRFIKELFGGDSDLYNETIKKLDTIGSLVSAISYIESNFSWDKNSDSVKQLISLVRRRYM